MKRKELLIYALIFYISSFQAFLIHQNARVQWRTLTLAFKRPSSETRLDRGLSGQVNENIAPEATNSSLTVKTKDVFSLDSIRSTLIRQEETIIFALIERAQYRSNRQIYAPNQLNFTDDNKESISFCDWMLLETEKLHAQVRRYTSPEEHPFFPHSIPRHVVRLPQLNYPSLLGTEKEKVNVNNEVKDWYINRIIDRLCANGDDEQYGSSVMADIAVLQAISRRVHYGIDLYYSDL